MAENCRVRFSRFYWVSSYYLFGENHGCVPIWSIDCHSRGSLAYFVFGEHHGCVPNLVFGVHGWGDGLTIDFLKEDRCFGHYYFISHNLDNLVLHFDPCMSFKFWIFSNTNHKCPFEWFCFCPKIIDKFSVDCMWGIDNPFKYLNYWKFVIL